jgi:hypothetical protein
LNLSSVALGTLSSFQVLLLNTARKIFSSSTLASSPVKGLSGSRMGVVNHLKELGSVSTIK